MTGPNLRRGWAGWSAMLAIAFATLVLALSLPPSSPVRGGDVLAAIATPVSTPPATASSAPATRPGRTPSPISEDIQQSRPTPTRPVVEVSQPTAISVIKRGKAIPTGGTAVFLGDSYTTGWNGAGLDVRGWPRLVAAEYGWKVVNLAVAGTGFMNPGWTGQPVASRVRAAVRARPDIVFIAAGHNNSRWSASTTAAAADAVVTKLRAALPDATIVIIAPIWQDGTPPARCLTLRDRLRRTARANGARFIDPLAEGWFAGSSHRFITADGIHPSDRGHRFIANRVLADLE